MTFRQNKTILETNTGPILLWFYCENEENRKAEWTHTSEDQHYRSIILITASTENPIIQITPSYIMQGDSLLRV